MKRGHDVTVLEASERTGGHVMSASSPFDDGLYADLGAEHCLTPTYQIYRAWVAELGLTLLPYRRRDHFLRYIDGKPYTEEMLADKNVLASFGLNQHEVDFLATRDWQDLRLLYFAPYFDRFKDEYQPFGVGLDDLDSISVTEFLKRAGASASAIRIIGLSEESALQEMWTLAFFDRRGRHDVLHKDCFRIQGGNQKLPDAFTANLGNRIKLNCPVTRHRRGSSGVTVYYNEHDEEKSLEADYLVCGIPLPAFCLIPAEPDWPEAKRWVMERLPYSVTSRIVFQCRTRFWRDDDIVPNLSTPDSPLHDGFWEMAHEVPGERGLLMSGGAAGVTESMARAELKRYYPGRLGDIEKVVLKHWYLEKWAPRCERQPFQIGELSKFWPQLLQPVGRIHFVGSGVDNGTGGQEAATRSAHRVATAIDQV
jgi:monoamine oxidase